MKRIAALAAWLLPLVLTPGASPGMMGAPARDGEVKAVSVVPAPGKVEVVIDLRGAVDVQDFTLSSPARLVIDLTGARLTAPATLYDGQNRGGVRNIRYAQFRPDVVRVVIDLDLLKDYQIKRSDKQVRVEIGADRTAFAAWSSRGAARSVAAVPSRPPPTSRPLPPPAPSPSPSGLEAAPVTLSIPSDPVSIDRYLAAHAG